MGFALVGLTVAVGWAVAVRGEPVLDDDAPSSS
jgi:hypothetical protein